MKSGSDIQDFMFTKRPQTLSLQISALIVNFNGNCYQIAVLKYYLQKNKIKCFTKVICLNWFIFLKKTL